MIAHTGPRCAVVGHTLKVGLEWIISYRQQIGGAKLSLHYGMTTLLWFVVWLFPCRVKSINLPHKIRRDRVIKGHLALFCEKERSDRGAPHSVALSSMLLTRTTQPSEPIDHWSLVSTLFCIRTPTPHDHTLCWCQVLLPCVRSCIFFYFSTYATAHML